MSQPFNHFIALNGPTRNPVNELLAAVMRSFGEESSPASGRESVPQTWTTGSEPGGSRAPASKSDLRTPKS